MNFEDIISRWGHPAMGQWLGRASERLPLALAVVLAIAIGYYLARLVWIVYLAIWPSGAQPVWQPPPRLGQVATAGALPLDSYRSIGAARLFGEVSAEVPLAAGETDVDAPDTTLSLQLRGAIAAADPKVAHAIIADSTGREKVYFLSDSLPGGATLSRVQADRVVLSRAGQLEILRLPRDSQGSGSPPVAAGRPAVLRTPAAAPAPAPGNVQELVAQQGAGFLDVVRPQPFMPNGQLRGYRIFPGPNRQQFAALGLRPGDLVTEINGIALNNPAQGMEVFRSLGDAAQVTVTVERDGQPQVLSLNLTDLTALGGAVE